MSEGNNKITVGQVTEQLNTKVDTDLGNIDSTTYPDGIDYVIEWQTPTAANNYTWYRKYKSGWVEQGGVSSNATTSGVLVTMPITMADTNYPILVSPVNGGAYSTSGYGGSDKTTTTFKVYSNNNNGRPAYWQVSGMSAN